jgi:CRP/FNR family nitrogen fixation transcriptional regulator
VDDVIFGQGARAQFVYIVKKGALFRFRLLPDGRKSILQFLFPGDSFGFEVGRHHRDTVQTLTDAKVLAVGKEALIAAAASSVGLSNLLLTAATRAIATAHENSIVLRGRPAMERLALFLLDLDTRLHGQLDLPMSRRHIANHLGLTIETISRAFSALERLKVIRFQDKTQQRIIIHNKQRLQQCAADGSDIDYWSAINRRKTKAETIPAASAMY